MTEERPTVRTAAIIPPQVMVLHFARPVTYRYANTSERRASERRDVETQCRCCMIYRIFARRKSGGPR